MAATQRPIVVGTFPSQAQAEKAIRELRAAGFAPGRIGFAMRDVTSASPPRHEPTDAEGLAVGAIAGGFAGTITGGALGVLLGTVVSLALPGIGPVLGA